MKKIIKSAICLVLCLIMITSVVPATVKAQGSSELDYVMQRAYDFVQFASLDSESYGLDYSGEDIYISQYFPAYKLNGDSIIECEGIGFYFIMSNNIPIAELTVIYGEDDITPSIQFSTELSLSYSEYNSNSFTVIIGTENYYFADYANTDKKIREVKLIENTDININTLISSDSLITTTSSYPSGYSVSLPIVSQGNYGLCWAACICSVGEHMTGTYHTPTWVADKVSIGYNAGATCNQVASALNTTYGLNATVINGVLYTSSVADILMSGEGIIAYCKPTQSATSAHNVAINGYSANSSGCYYSIMEPNSSYYKMMVNGTDSSGFNTYYFALSDGTIFYWYASIHVYK